MTPVSNMKQRVTQQYYDEEILRCKDTNIIFFINIYRTYIEHIHTKGTNLPNHSCYGAFIRTTPSSPGDIYSVIMDL